MPTERDKQVGQKIKGLRKLHQESQAEFAERFGVEQATVSRWEKGSSPPERRFEKPIADLAGMTVGQFFHSEEQPRLVPIVGEFSALNGLTFSEKVPAGAPVAHVSLDVGSNDQIGLTIRGNTLFPAYRDGDVILAQRLPKNKWATAIGEDCIVKTTDGRDLIGVLRKGRKRGKYDLKSLSPAVEDAEDTSIKWAARIRWIGRAAKKNRQH